MPHLNFKLYPGKDPAVLDGLAEKLRNCLAEESGIWKPTDISVSIEEIGPDEFEAKARESFKDGRLVIPSDYIK